MAVEYEDIDLGQVSEVTKKEFDLTKLEAEGWVTELVIANGFPDARFLVLDGSENGEVVAIKINDELVQVEYFDEEDSGGSYGYKLEWDMPAGTVIKIYHNPNVDLWCYFSLYDAEYEGTPRYDIRKCVRHCAELVVSNVDTCYSLPETIDYALFITARQIIPKMPNLKFLEVNTYEENHLDIYLDALPEIIDTETDCTFYVPYHLLEEAKATYPHLVQHIDALLPVSQSPKLYRHEVNIIESPINPASGVEKFKNVITFSFLSYESSSLPEGVIDPSVGIELPISIDSMYGTPAVLEKASEWDELLEEFGKIEIILCALDYFDAESVGIVFYNGEPLSFAFLDDSIQYEIYDVVTPVH